MHENYLSSTIFTPALPLPEILGQPRSRQEVLKQIHADPQTLLLFNRLSLSEREALLEFCMGNRNLKITYDPFFRNIFHPEIYPGRLGRFLSAILGQPVTVRGILSREGVRLTAEASLMIMDILVELENGSLINVEMQKVGYKFPIERAFCYGSDLLVRQYDRARAALGNKFTYESLRPVYVIVLLESSPAIFHRYPNSFLHRSSLQLDSGLPIKNILNFIFIPLDIFLKLPHNELTELEAWLYFLSSDNPLHIQQITTKYPFFKELYQDIINLRYHPKELINMFSESLLIADRNTVTLMIDELRQELEVQKGELSELESELTDTQNELSLKNAELSGAKNELSLKNAELSEKDAEIARLKALLKKA